MSTLQPGPEEQHAAAQHTAACCSAILTASNTGRCPLRRLAGRLPRNANVRGYTTVKASSYAGDGWCPYSDITLAVRRLRQASNGRLCRCMIIDTDAHQGNGYARDKLNNQDHDLFIVDLYNAGRSLFPVIPILVTQSGDSHSLSCLQARPCVACRNLPRRRTCQTSNRRGHAAELRL